MAITYTFNPFTSNFDAINSGGAAPVAPTVQRFTSGSGTYTTPAGALYIVIECVGSGGSGAGSGTAAGAGANGDSTTFGTSFIDAGGGVAGVLSGLGGTGGTTAITLANGGGSGSILISLEGNGGETSVGSGSEPLGAGGHCGGAGPFGGAGRSSMFAAATNSLANSGSGGPGAGLGAVAALGTGSGGGAGGYCKVLEPTPLATYAYVVGAAKTGGAAGTSGYAGGNSGSGIIIVTEYYQ